MFTLCLDKFYRNYVAFATEELDCRDIKHLSWSFVHRDNVTTVRYHSKTSFSYYDLLEVDIPLFGEDMEGCYSYQPEYPNTDFRMQSKILEYLGFMISEKSREFFA